jgi:hypothetical protein|tara:strand:- start:81 stop:1349 length:1269 start_codon:yes stop_codon:yes gene_type:complete
MIKNDLFTDFDMSMKSDRKEVKELLKLKFNQRCKKMKRQGKEYIYTEQQKFSLDILNSFKKGVHITTFVAPVQWGKTGVILSLINECCTDDEIFINPNNVLVMTGMSDNEWKSQTQSRMIAEFKNSVHHLHGMNNMKLDDDFRDGLIIIDECQIANKEEQSIRKMFIRNNLFDMDFLKKRNIRIVQTSATPDNSLVDAREYPEDEHYCCIVNIDLNNPNRSYKFFTDIDEDHLKETMNLSEMENMEELFKDITSFKKARWHIIRIPSDKKDDDDDVNITCKNIQICANKYNCDIRYHMMCLTIDENKEPEEVLASRPDSGKHTIIIIKNKWRASKSIPDKYIGVVHDRFTKLKPQFASEVQSLAGRMVGHGKMKSKYKSIIYCQKKCIKEYIDLFSNNFNYDEIIGWKKTKKPSYLNKYLKK